MILKCSNCLNEYDVSEQEADASIKCECGDVIVVPEFADLEGVMLINKYIELLAKEEQLDLEQVKNDEGWELQRGSARIQISYDKNDDLLTIESSIMPLPNEESSQFKLGQRLLKLNHRDTGLARFATTGNQVLVTFSRDTIGLDYPEFHHAIECVCRTADDYDDILRAEFLGDDPTRVEEDEVIDLSRLS